MRKIKPKYNETRVKGKFLFFPKTLKCSIHENVRIKRWLEFVEIWQEYRPSDIAFEKGKWFDISWNDL